MAVVDPLPQVAYEAILLRDALRVYRVTDEIVTYVLKDRVDKWRTK